MSRRGKRSGLPKDSSLVHRPARWQGPPGTTGETGRVLVAAGTVQLHKRKWWRHPPGPDPKSTPALSPTNRADEGGRLSTWAAAAKGEGEACRPDDLTGRCVSCNGDLVVFLD